MSDQSNNAVLALIAGVAIGAGLGILFAPDSGQKTREKLKAGIDEYSGELQEHLNELKSGIRTSVSHAGEKIAERFEHSTSDSNEDTELAIAQLEAKLAQLKAKLA
jgi:gas vesicle protein